MIWAIGHFKSSEFKCRCAYGCGLDKVDHAFLWKLNLARDYAGIAFVITSGCRCEQHNKDVSGSEYSDHLCLPTCEGADIQAENSKVRFRIISAAISAGFKRIGVAKTFIHLGNRGNNPMNVIWVY